MNQELAEAIIKWDDHEEVEFFEEVTKEEFSDQSRWSTFYYQVWKDTRDGTFWSIVWSRGSTEYQDNGPEDVIFEQVEPKEVTRIEYVAVKK